MTCQYRCGNARAHPAPNSSNNPYFGDLVSGELSRRGLLRAGALGALVVGAGAVASGTGSGIAEAAVPAGAGGASPRRAQVPPSHPPWSGCLTGTTRVTVGKGRHGTLAPNWKWS